MFTKPFPSTARIYSREQNKDHANRWSLRSVSSKRCSQEAEPHREETGSWNKREEFSVRVCHLDLKTVVPSFPFWPCYLSCATVEKTEPKP